MKDVKHALFAGFLTKIVKFVFEHHRSILPSRQVGPFLLIGTDHFIAITTNCLRLLERDDIHGYRMVRRFLHAIVGKEGSQKFGYVFGVHFEVVYASGEAAWDTKRIAAHLVRSAVKARLFREHDICLSNERAQSLALRRELRSMEQLGCGTQQLHEQREFLIRMGN